ncbi:MAG TPA: hypothetical protein VN416_03230 [Desulfomonilia bacterium]|nr:hypothetical protein [Desulfomonilia bacterium]
MKLKPMKGYAVLLGESEHSLAAFKGLGETIRLDQASTIDSNTLMGLSKKSVNLSLCFSPRTIYSDIGDFSCVSQDATSAHIRSTLDKIGLFKDEYRISFTKLQIIDNLKCRYSYLAIPNSELNRVEFVDGNNAIVDTFCPIEASLAAALGTVEKDMAVLIYEDTHFIRIIAAKDGVIYHLITINAAESFDALADTVSGIREMTSLLMNSYKEKVKTVYMIGDGQVGREDLHNTGIEVEPFHLGSALGSDTANPVLYGTAIHPRYDFTTEKLQKTKLLARYAKVSLGVSLVMIVIAALFIAMGWSNVSKAQDLRKRFHAETSKSSRELRELERNYTLVSKDLDLTNINAIVQAYKDFQSEPRLHTIVDTISHQVPTSVFLTRIEVIRPNKQQDSPPARVESQEGAALRTTHVDSFGIVISGVINAPYPHSKEVFSTFMTNMQGVYSVESATFNHKELYAEFSLNCEMNL